MKTRTHIPGAVLVLTAVMGFLLSTRADDDPAYTVQVRMKGVFKGEDSVHKRILKGSANEGRSGQNFVEYISKVTQNDPPQGDPDGWKKKTTALLIAARALQAGENDALAQYAKAANCQACHSVYRPD